MYYVFGGNDGWTFYGSCETLRSAKNMASKKRFTQGLADTPKIYREGDIITAGNVTRPSLWATPVAYKKKGTWVNTTNEKEQTMKQFLKRYYTEDQPHEVTYEEALDTVLASYRDNREVRSWLDTESKIECAYSEIIVHEI